MDDDPMDDPTATAPPDAPPGPGIFSGGKALAIESGVALAALVAWVWLLWPLRERPAEWLLLAAAVPGLAVLGVGVQRSVGGAPRFVGAAAMGIAGFVGLVLFTGGGPATLASFILGVLKPAGWRGDHLLLRALPLLMLLAHPWRHGWAMAAVSALGVTAFLGIGLMILRAAG